MRDFANFKFDGWSGKGKASSKKLALELMPEEPWDDDTWTTWTNAIKEKTGRKGKELFLPLRVAFTGLTHGPEMKLLIQLIGRDKIVERIQT